MTHRPIFIIGQPRSGTTLLMRLLNVSPHVRVYGEHGGSANYITTLHRALCKDHVELYRFNITDEEAEAELSTGKSWCNMVGAVQTREIEGLCRNMLEAIGNPFHKNVRWGFKEVNIVSDNFVNTLVELYPECRVIMTTRNPVEMLLSTKRLGWCLNSEAAINEWAWRMKEFVSAAEKYPSNCRLYRYEDLKKEKVEEILKWVEIEPLPVHYEVLDHRVGESPVRPQIGLSEQERRLIDERDTFGYYPNEFQTVYAKGGWDNSGSGPGSTPEYCVKYIAWLQQWLRDNRIKSVVDAGCGDWQSTRNIDWSGIDYLGLDLVPSVIDRNRILYAAKNVKFAYSDALVDPMPLADMLIVKDVIHHLSHAQVRKMVEASRKFPTVLWVVEMGEAIPHGAWPDETLCRYFSRMPVLFTFENPPGYPYGLKQVLLATNPEARGTIPSPPSA